MLLARMAATLQPPVRPAKTKEQAVLAELINARDGLVRDRTALKNREKNLTISILKRQCKQRLDQIGRHIEALDAEIASIIAADPAMARRHEILTSIGGLGALTANQLIAQGKPTKIAITAVMRKLIVIANALLKADRLRVKSIA
jgi:transposase